MNAIEFVKKYGIDEAKKAIENVAWCETAYCMRLKHGCFKTNSDCCIDINDLKQIVEAFEIIGLFKNLDHAKVELLACETAMHSQILVKLDVGMGYIDIIRVKKAINLVEQCQ